MKPLIELMGFALLWLLLVVMTMGIGSLFVPVYWALVFRGRDAREQTALAKLQGTLMAHEKILERALQLRICSLQSRRLLIAVTNSRVITIARPLLGGFSMKDYQWKDLQNVELAENVLPNYFGSRLTFHVRRDGQSPASFSVDGINSALASKIYSEAQTQEQAWEEKRRVRELEEKRAASGGISLGSAAIGGGSSERNGSPLDELERAKKLFDSGAVSDAEYQEIKAKILSRQAF